MPIGERQVVQNMQNTLSINSLKNNSSKDVIYSPYDLLCNTNDYVIALLIIVCMTWFSFRISIARIRMDMSVLIEMNTIYLCPWMNSVKEIKKENMIIPMQHSFRVLHIFSINSMHVFVTM